MIKIHEKYMCFSYKFEVLTFKSGLCILELEADDESSGVSDVWSRGVALLLYGTWLPTSAFCILADVIHNVFFLLSGTA